MTTQDWRSAAPEIVAPGAGVEQPRLRVGVSAAKEQTRVARNIAITGVVALVPVVAWFVMGADSHWLELAIRATIIGGLPAMALLIPSMRDLKKAMNRETAAGYTTISPRMDQLSRAIGGRPASRDHLWRLDPETGEVIARPRTSGRAR